MLLAATEKFTVSLNASVPGAIVRLEAPPKVTARLLAASMAPALPLRAAMLTASSVTGEVPYRLENFSRSSLPAADT